MTRIQSRYSISFRSRKLTGKGFTRRVFWIDSFKSADSWEVTPYKKQAEKFTETEARQVIAALASGDFADVTTVPPLPAIAEPAAPQFIVNHTHKAATKAEADVYAARLINILTGDLRDPTDRPYVATAGAWRLTLEDIRRHHGIVVAIDVQISAKGIS